MNKKTILILSHIGGAVLGGLVGYLVAASFFDKRYRAIVELFDEELDSFREDAKVGRQIRRRVDATHGNDPVARTLAIDASVTSLHGYASKLNGLGYSEPSEEDDAVETETKALAPWEQEILDSVFSPPEFDPKNWVSKRDPNNPDKPYLISVDEFIEADKLFQNISLSYFEEDDVLCDDQERVVPDIEGTVGKENLLHFGECDPADKYLIYVRNERLEVDFEVCREETSYSHVVLGLDEEYLGDKLAKPRPKKMRQDV